MYMYPWCHTLLFYELSIQNSYNHTPQAPPVPLNVPPGYAPPFVPHPQVCNDYLLILLTLFCVIDNPTSSIATPTSATPTSATPTTAYSINDGPSTSYYRWRRIL